MAKKKQCKKNHCRERAEILGYCRPHYQEHLDEEILRDLAVATLHDSPSNGQPASVSQYVRRLRLSSGV